MATRPKSLKGHTRELLNEKGADAAKAWALRQKKNYPWLKESHVNGWIKGWEEASKPPPARTKKKKEEVVKASDINGKAVADKLVKAMKEWAETIVPPKEMDALSDIGEELQTIIESVNERAAASSKRLADVHAKFDSILTNNHVQHINNNVPAT